MDETPLQPAPPSTPKIDAPLLEAIEAGAAIVTVNRRLAAHLHEAYGAQQRSAGLEVWATPDILPLSAWVRRGWDAAREALAGRGGAEEPPVLLPDHVAEAVWETIVKDSAAGAELLNPEGAAGLAAKAYKLEHQWRLPRESPGAPASEEVRAYRAWAERYEARCNDEGWLDGALLAERVAAAVQRGAVPVPPRLMVTGFDEVPPQEAALFEALAAAGCQVERHEPKLQPAAAVRAAFPDPLAEIEAAARWARRLLEQGAPGPIGIVAPRLEAIRADVERIFRDLLSPGEPLRPFGAREPFDISLAPPLAEAPVVQAALLLLRPWHRPAPADEISQVLLSPFFSGAERELTTRAALDARLRRWGAPALDWGTVANLAGEGETACPKLREAIEGARAAEGKQPASQSPAQWAAAFAGILNDLGWPGERTQSSAERQAFEAWRECLGEFARLELAFPRLSRADASTRLRRLAESREFQPKRETAPVQVLGVLESGGLTFSHLWMLGFDDRIWPAPARPNPFLPLGLQRSAGLPHASAQRELAYAEGETRRLLGSAPQAVASHAVLHGDQEFRVSPLLEGLPEVEPGAIPQSGLVGLREAMRNGGPLEVLEDFRVPALPAGSQVRGGVGLFRDQAACPFRAFALHRLHAEPLESPHPGIDAAGRGNTLHHAMDELWGNVKTHAALCELSELELNRRIDEAAARAVERFAERNRHLAGSRLLELERERLAALIRDFLPSERERQPFEVVAREAEHTASFGGISVQVRVDRIDRLLSGGHIVIDYKTGRSELSSWFGERPREPQLPLYCSSADLDLAGVAYARLSRAALGFRALAAEASLLPKAAPFDGYTDRTTGETYRSAQDLVRRWRGVLDGLGEGFRSGDARVDPREQDSPCRTCPLPALCRVHELALAGTANDEEEADE